VLLGSTISDTATLSGTANKPGTPIINPTTAGAGAGGTITFIAYGPNDCTTIAFTSSVPVSGNSSYGSGSFTPTAVGTYTFVASYSGDSPNTNGVGSTACPDTSGTETVTVTDTSAVVTDQNWLPNDSATITSKTALAGTVVLTLYDNGTCNGNILYATGTLSVGPGTLANGIYSQTVNSSNTSVKVSTSTTVSWSAVYTSTAANVTGNSSSCETTTLTIDNHHS
jgi:hypothetical protein